MVKYYNPFKPHIVKDGFGAYWIRIYRIFTAEYYCTDTGSFYFDKTCATCSSTLDCARGKLQEAKAAIQEDRVHKNKQRKKDEVIFDN